VDNFKSKKEEEGFGCEKLKKADSNYSEKETWSKLTTIFTIIQVRKNQSHWYAIAIYIKLFLLFIIILQIGFLKNSSMKPTCWKLRFSLLIWLKIILRIICAFEKIITCTNSWFTDGFQTYEWGSQQNRHHLINLKTH